MKLTRHAKDQMLRRGISPANIQAVLMSGRKIETELPHILRHELCGLYVVEDTSTGVIVTTFFDDGPKYKRRKRNGA